MSASCGRGKIAANPDMGFPAKIDKTRQQIILAENPPPYRRRAVATNCIVALGNRPGTNAILTK
jgi:hypothetical protein